MNSQYLIRASKKRDEALLAKLTKNAFGFNEDFWIWKHKRHPSFNHSSIIIAEIDGEVIGASSWIPRDLKISNFITVRAAVGGDTIVHPNYRGQGVGSSIMKEYYERLKGSGVMVIYGFATKEVAKKFYLPQGNILMRDSIIRYSKILNCSRWRKKIASIAKKANGPIRKLKGQVTIRFALKGAPPFSIVVENGKIDLEEMEGKGPKDFDVVIEGKLSLLMPFLEGRRGIFDLAKLLVRRKINTKGVLLNSITLFRVFRIIAPAFRKATE